MHHRIGKVLHVCKKLKYLYMCISSTSTCNIISGKCSEPEVFSQTCIYMYHYGVSAKQTVYTASGTMFYGKIIYLYDYSYACSAVALTLAFESVG